MQTKLKIALDRKLSGMLSDHWILDTPIDKSLKCSQVYPDSPFKRPKSKMAGPSSQQLHEQHVPTNRSFSSSENALKMRKSQYRAVRLSFDSTKSIRKQSSDKSGSFPETAYHNQSLDFNAKVSEKSHRYSQREVTKSPDFSWEPYSILDYKNLVLPRLGGLGPSHIASNERRLRLKNYRYSQRGLKKN